MKGKRRERGRGKRMEGGSSRSRDPLICNVLKKQVMSLCMCVIMPSSRALS